MDAQSLFREGVLAVREGKDLHHARQLLLQSLKLNPQNEMAWLWLAQTVTEPQKKLECVNRALKINPANEKAQQLYAKLSASAAPAYETVTPPAPVAPPPPPSSIYAFDDEDEPFSEPAPRSAFHEDDDPFVEVRRDLVDDAGLRAAPTIRQPLTPNEEKQVAALLAKAESLLKSGKAEDTESAVEQWVRVLEIRVDHEIAIQNAVRYLARLGYMDDAKQLIWRAIDAGTLLPSIYVTAVDIAQRMRDHNAALEMAAGLLPLHTVDDALILKITDQMVKYGQGGEVIALLEKALVHRPKSQKIMVRVGELLDEMGRKEQAMRYFDRAARVKSGTKEAKLADKALMQFTPIITDRERGSPWLALREAFGFTVLYFFLAWQDAGLNLAFMGIRWIGVLLSLVGGYMVITAVSSPQQQPLARWLGGTIPPPQPQKRVVDAYGNPVEGMSGALQDPTELPILPDAIRAIFLVGGTAILAFSFYVVFSSAIQLLFNPVPPSYIPDIEELLMGGLR